MQTRTGRVMTNAEETTRSRWYWETFDPHDHYAGAELAVLRKGIGRDVGDVWQMSRHYRSVTKGGGTSNRLAAEHAALSLFAVHQQSQTSPMHSAGTGLGTAARRLHTPAEKARATEASQQPAEGKFSEEAINRRMGQIATSSSVTELVAHLRGLVTMLRTIQQPLDYTRLRQQIERWHYPDARTGIRAQWGSQFFQWQSTGTSGSQRP
jgi:CRISPR system Cascade subunit CasB